MEIERRKAISVHANENTGDEEDEDTSDEAFTSRHEQVLKQMREKWALRQKLKLEHRGHQMPHSRSYSISEGFDASNSNGDFNLAAPLAETQDSGVMGIVSPRKRAGSHSHGSKGGYHPRKRGRPPKLSRSGSIDDAMSPRVNGDHGADDGYDEDYGLGVSTPFGEDKYASMELSESNLMNNGSFTANIALNGNKHYNNTDVSSASSHASKKKFSASSRVLSASSIGSMISCSNNSGTSPIRLDDGDGEQADEDRMERGW
jgi:hypothetical protein